MRWYENASRMWGHICFYHWICITDKAIWKYVQKVSLSLCFLKSLHDWQGNLKTHSESECFQEVVRLMRQPENASRMWVPLLFSEKLHDWWMRWPENAFRLWVYLCALESCMNVVTQSKNASRPWVLHFLRSCMNDLKLHPECELTLCLWRCMTDKVTQKCV